MAQIYKNLMHFHIDPEKCKKYSLCARSCPSNAIIGEIGRTPYEIDQNRYIKCGSCVNACPLRAISKI